MKNLLYCWVAMISVCFACNKQPGVPAMTMTMRIDRPYPLFWPVTILLSGTGSVTIDWGDNNSETFTLNAYKEDDWAYFDNKYKYNHAYSASSTYTIRIEGENITHMTCNSSGGELTSLNVRENNRLEYLDCWVNQLTSLDVSKNTLLKSLICQNNQLKDLDLRENIMLTFLNCRSNQLTSLDLSKNTKLTELDCTSNQLTSLDVSKNILLYSLNCWSNQLSGLDVSKNTLLTYLDCGSNQLSGLDVSKNIALWWLGCADNQIIN